VFENLQFNTSSHDELDNHMAEILIQCKIDKDILPRLGKRIEKRGAAHLLKEGNDSIPNLNGRIPVSVESMDEIFIILWVKGFDGGSSEEVGIMAQIIVIFSTTQA
jgi:hypothetical protein